jgi:release factor glutamine methyltransferase
MTPAPPDSEDTMDPAAMEELKARIAALLADHAGAAAEAEAAQLLAAALAETPGDPAGTALAWAARRARGAPLGLVLGRQRFHGLELLAGDDVLAPREETELLAGEAVALLQAGDRGQPGREPRWIDMGCGSGNLTCALAAASPRARIWASDITPSCAELTRRNVDHLGLSGRVQVCQGDLFAPLAGLGLEGTMDGVVMNPPYIPSASLERTHANLLAHEPREAFDGGPYGVSILTRLLHDAPGFLRPGGHLLFEFGLGQARLVQALARKQPCYADLRLVADPAGEPRVAVLTLGETAPA